MNKTNSKNLIYLKKYIKHLSMPQNLKKLIIIKKINQLNIYKNKKFINQIYKLLIDIKNENLNIKKLLIFFKNKDRSLNKNINIFEAKIILKCLLFNETINKILLLLFYLNNLNKKEAYYLLKFLVNFEN